MASKLPLQSSSNANVAKAPASSRAAAGKTIEQMKSQLEYILLRPDTYIGSIEKHTQTLWVCENEEMVCRSVTYVPGLYKIFDEILVNAADNKQRDPSMDSVKVVIDVEQNLISVCNNGDRVPVVIDQEEGVYVPEMIFGHLLTSSNYDDNVKKTTGGRNGYGAKLTNIFSTEFIIETADGKRLKKYKQVFENNMGKKSEPVITKCNKSENWTKVTFKPDLKKFNMTELENDVVALMSKRVFDIAGCLGKTVKVELNGKRVPIKSFSDYVDLYLSAANKSRTDPLPRMTEKVNDRWEVCVSLSDGQFQQVSFVNSIATIKGGTHVDYVTSQVTNYIVGIVNKKNKNANVKTHNVKNHLWVFVNALIDNPAFDSQTKETLTLRQSSFGSKCELSEDILKKVAKSGVVENLLSWATFKQSKELKKSNGVETTGRVEVEKLEDAKQASPSSSSLSGFLHSLPEAVTTSCLARVSRLDHAALSLVSKSYRSMVVSSELYQTRSLMGYAEKFIYVCLTIPPDSTPSWFILRPTLDVATGNTVNRAHPIPSFPSQPREGFAVVALDWGIYVIGGWVNGKRTSGVLVLDCRSHKWHHVTSMRVARVSAEARVVDGKIYVLGGCKKKRYSDWGEVFDPKTQTWADLQISKPMVESTSPIMSLIHGNVIRRCYYLPSQSKWKRKKQINRTNKLWPHDRKPTYSKDWCVINKLIYTCGNDGGIYWCEAKDLDQCDQTVGTISWKKVLGRTLGLQILEESLFNSRAVYFGGKMIKMWESYKIMYNISKNLDELLPGTNLTNFGQNIMVFSDNLADVRGNKRLQIWCAEISLERQSCGEVWGECEWFKSVLVVDLVTVDPFLYNSKVLCSIPVDV